LRARDLTLGYTSATEGEFVVACQGIDIEIAEHEFVAVVGPSGSGKTTFLEAVAGLLPVAGGELSLYGKQIVGPSPERSLVFQRASLLPWRNVLDNVLFSLQAQKKLNAETRRRALDMLELVGLSHATTKYPRELSGGMMQRVNLARALVTEPRLLLLDEPFGALDAQTRGILQNELLSIWEKADQMGVSRTALFVTHDVHEAVLLADRVIVFSGAPARVATEVRIDGGRPRSPEWAREARFTEYCDEITALLHSQNADIPKKGDDR